MLAGVANRVRRVNKYRQRIGQLGLRESFKRVYRSAEIVYLFGDQVGTDKLGNIYYELPEDAAVSGRQRFVWFSDPNYEASTIPPQWHAWLHYFTDVLPTEDIVAEYQPQRYGPPTHTPNLTGSDKAYAPPTFLGNKAWRPAKEHWKIWSAPKASAQTQAKPSEL